MCRCGQWRPLPGDALLVGDLVSISRPTGGEDRDCRREAWDRIEGVRTEDGRNMCQKEGHPTEDGGEVGRDGGDDARG